jgi:hypothetical protein
MTWVFLLKRLSAQGFCYDCCGSITDVVVRQHRCVVAENTKSIYLQNGNAPQPVRKQLAAAEEMRRAQTLAIPPADMLWSYFDLAELLLHQKDEAGFLENLQSGIEACTADWQPQTFCKSLLTLVAI